MSDGWREIDELLRQPLWWALNEDHTTRPCDAFEAYALLRDYPARCVAETELDDWRVSTVFLALDHSFVAGPPLLFETMVFSRRPGEHPHEDHWCERYSTWWEAEAGHREVVARLRQGLSLD